MPALKISITKVLSIGAYTFHIYILLNFTIQMFDNKNSVSRFCIIIEENSNKLQTKLNRA